MGQSMQEDNAQHGGSSFFGKLKSVLFEDEPQNRAPPIPSTKAVTSPTASAVLPTSAFVSSTNPMVEPMMKIVMAKTTAYTALMEAISPLEGYIPDEGSRYKAAFGIVGKTRTVEQIFQAIDMQHLQTLDEEAQRFQSQAKNKEDQEIAARLKTIETLRATASSANEEALRIRKQLENRMQELKTQVDESLQKVSRIEQEVASTRLEISQTNQQFVDMVTIVKSRLNEAKAKVKQYLGT